MKFAPQFILSTLALAGLLFQADSRATNLSEQPLKASVLARPAVLFGMDNSGSMDAEVMIDLTVSGMVFGNTSNATLYPGGTRRNGSASGDAEMRYLFPNGTGAGNRSYDDSVFLAIPPTPQLAWTRSADYNPIYYNPNKTYTPWAPAYVGGATQTFLAAAPAAAKSHPLLGSTTMTLNANINSSSANWVFTFTAGMIIPTGATSISCASGGAGGLPYTVTTSNQSCKAAISYYPATYWTKETCTVNGTSCVTNYDGNTLKRYEIKLGSYATPAVYTAAMQNFANWFTYYRKRRLLLAAAMGEVLENLTGVRMGVVAFNPNATPTMYDSDATAPASNGMAVAGRFYSTDATGMTPTHATFAYLRTQFNSVNNIVQYACQRNAAFIITDGFANDGATTPPSYSQSTYGSGTPYQSIASGSLADQALAYFTLPLRADLSSGRVPLGPQNIVNPDPNPNLHINTYALTMGMKGTLWPNIVSPFVTAPSWPAPVSDTATMIDDLWHATINGRGQMYLATDVDTTSAAIQSGLADIKSQNGAQSAAAVSTVNLNSGDGQAYLASYNPSGWTGNVTANTVDTATGDISASNNWSASALLLARDWTTRAIVTSNGSSGASGGGLAFTSANIGVTVNPDPLSYTNAAVVDYLRGSRSGEGSTFRTRSSLIGAVINSEPVIDIATGVLYAASGEGMLHAFSTTTGVEQWAFVPYGALSSIGATVDRGYPFKTKLDGPLSLGKYSATGKLLVGAMGAAGRSYYALDVTTPTGLTETQAATKVKWTFPSITQATQQALMGYPTGKPLIVKTAANGQVVLVTSGYDNGLTIGDGKGRMWMLNADTGAVISTFVTTAGATAAEAGLAQLSAYREDDGSVQFVYAGDLLGNLWKFDLVAGTTTLLAVLKDSTGATQPVTTAPQLTRINNTRVVMVGTGRLLDINDFGVTAVQSLYAIRDGAYLSNARSSLTALSHNTGTQLISGTVDWTTSRGWYLDLPSTQIINTDPKLVLGRLFFNTNVTGGTNCAQSSNAYVVDVKTGGGESEALSSTANATHPLVVQSGEKLFRWTRFNDSTVQNKDVSSNTPIAARKNSWKVISR